MGKRTDPEFIKAIENIDFIVLTGTWSAPEIDINISGYNIYASHRPKKDAASRPSGGVAVYCKDIYNSKVECMLQNEVCVILKLNKSILGTDIDIMLTGIYISPPSPGCHKNNIDPYVILNKAITKLCDDLNYIPYFIFAGDTNSRVGTEQDYAHVDYDLSCFIDLIDEAGVDTCTKRFSKDIVITPYGRQLLELCISLKIRLLNGRCGVDQGVGEYTVHSPGGMGSVVDYFITSEAILQNIVYFEVCKPSILSDHCQLICSYQVRNSETSVVTQPQQAQGDKGLKRINWSQINVNKWNLEMVQVVESISVCVNSNKSVEDKVLEISNALYSTASNCRIDSIGTEYVDECVLAAYMFDECKRIYKLFSDISNTHKLPQYKTQHVRAELVRRRHVFHKHSVKCKRDYVNGLTEKLTGRYADFQRFKILFSIEEVYI